MTTPRRLVVFAPNWLGDAVMALPILAALRRAWPETAISVAARPSVAPLYSMVPAVDDTIVLHGRAASAVRRHAPDVAALARGQHDAALLLPNSFLSAWLAWRAGIPARWGIARDLRGGLLTLAIPRPRRYAHQLDYYRAILEGLGVPPGDRYAALTVPPEARASAQALLDEHRLPGGAPFVVCAAGAAYGRAKQWPPERFAELARLVASRNVATVLVGAKGDQAACREVAAAAPAVDLSGRTDLPTLAGVLSLARAVVSNDSGAMHLAAAVGTPVVAVFGPTDERRTAPLAAHAQAPPATIVATDVWCRPCMLRECPIDHRCMTRIDATRVLGTVIHALSGALAGVDAPNVPRHDQS